MKAKKSFGQHFLGDEKIAEDIANSLSFSDYDKIVEVGPGRGMLTKYLLDKKAELIVIEADRDMVMHIQKHYPALRQQIVSADFLKVDLSMFWRETPFGLIGNFPYNISTQILFKMLDYKAIIPEMVGMFQKEVAERVVSKEGTKVYGVISVLIQAYYDGEYLFTVEPESFIPPPKVRSAVIRLTRKANQDLGCDYKLFRRVVKQAFSQRRKMLRNTMKAFIKDDPLLDEDFFKQRPEQISVADYIDLTNKIEKRITNN